MNLFNNCDFEQTIALQNFNVLSTESFLHITKRQVCTKCGKNRMYFCYDCRIYMPEVELLTPKVKLPVQIEIIKHQLERNSKSTAVHCLLLAPDSTHIYDKFNDIPNYAEEIKAFNEKNTVIVYPAKNALSINDYVEKNGPIKRFIFLDATWWTVNRLKNLPQLSNIPSVVLKTYKTLYWRPQKNFSDEYLATIEAIYYAVCENYNATQKYSNKNKNVDSNFLTSNLHLEKKTEEFDNLLFWFFFFRSMVNPEKRKNNRLL